MGINSLLDDPLYGGSVTSALVPFKFPVAIAGRGFMVDLQGDPFRQSDAFRHSTIDIIRQQQDTSNRPGEHSINPEGQWRRTQQSWHHGAGQSYYDRDDSDPYRFRSSKGVDVWTKWQISLLADTVNKRSSSQTNLKLATAGTYLYLLDGATLQRTQDLASFTAITGPPATPGSAIASDGETIWTAHGADGIYSTTRGAAGMASYNTLAATQLGYVKGRLMAAAGSSIYNVTAGGAPPAALFPHPNTDFAWVGFAEGNDRIYAAGFSGDKSEVYRLSIKPDGSGLDAAIPATPGLPDGEIIRSIGNYLGYILLGTDKGVRFCTTDSGSGDLNIGSLIPTPAAVNCFEGQDHFIWFGWTNYDTSSSGLGRMDLLSINPVLAPAFASDLMATAQGAVVSVVTFASKRLFTVSGVGLFAEDANRVVFGTIDSGCIGFGIPDPKIGLFLDVKHDTMPTGAAHRAYVAVDGAAFNLVGTHDGSNEIVFPIGEARAELFELREELDRATDPTKGPTLTAQTLRALPAVVPDEEITVPLIIADRLDLDFTDEARDVVDDVLFLKALRDNRDVVAYQEGRLSYSVVVDALQWTPHHRIEDDQWVGQAVLRMKVVR